MNRRLMLILVVVLVAVVVLALLFLLRSRREPEGPPAVISEKPISPPLEKPVPREEIERPVPPPEEKVKEEAKVPPPPPEEEPEEKVEVPSLPQPVPEEEVLPEEPITVAKEKELKEIRPKTLSHIVVKGECLWLIASYESYYGDPLKWTWIYSSNSDQIMDPDLIYPGQVFSLPLDQMPELKENPYEKVAGTKLVIVSKDERGREFFEHFVRWGESLWKIAGYKRYYADPTQWREIYETNRDRIDDPNLIFPKQVLKVPRD